jgi:hypothetical protein
VPDLGAPGDLAQLCDDLAALYRALGTTQPDRPYTGIGPVQDRSQTAPAFAAALTPTAPNVSSRRRVPSSRPPLDLTALEAQQQIHTKVADLLRDVRAALDLPDRPTTALRGLQALPRLVEALPEAHHQARRVPAVLEALRARARHVLDLDERWFVLGECPEIHQDAIPVAWDVAGRPVAYVEVRDCVTYDLLASLDATRKRRAGHPGAGPVDVWRRSHIRIDRDADLTTATAVCSGCDRTWDARERARLGKMLERDAAARLMAGQA